MSSATLIPPTSENVLPSSGISDVGEAFEAFCEHLVVHRGRDVTALAELGRGFENWVRFEFLTRLTLQHGLVAAPREGDQYADVGLERRTSFAPSRRTAVTATRQRTAWIRSSRIDAEAFHYVEFEVASGPRIAERALASVTADLRHMRALRTSSPLVASVNLIALGVHFDSEAWSQSCRLASQRAKRDPERIRHLVGDLHWALWAE